MLKNPVNSCSDLKNGVKGLSMLLFVENSPTFFLPAGQAGGEMCKRGFSWVPFAARTPPKPNHPECALARIDA